MKILLENYRVRAGGHVLAKEIGLEESEVLLTLEAAIQTSGVKRDGIRMIARSTNQLSGMFQWCTGAHAKKVLEKLRDKDYVFIDDNTLLSSDTTLWYGLNWKQIKTLTSVVVMDDGEIEAAHESKQKPNLDRLEQEKAKLHPNGSHAHQALFGTFIRACDFRQELLTPRDRAEIGSSVKKLLAEYAGQSVETEEIQRAVLGFRIWWIEEGKKFRTVRPAPRPYVILSNWGKFETAMRERGAMPDVPEEWL